MTAIRITGGCGAGIASYEDGVFAMPDGTLRGAETLSAIEGPEADAPASHWSGEILRGMQGAMASAKGLPAPLSVAASAVGLGIDVFAGKPAAVSVRATFTDGAEAVIEANAAFAALIERDRAVIRAALSRQVPVVQPAEQPVPADPAPVAAAEQATTSMFEYEKRNGRIRRVSGNASPRKDPVEA